MDVVYLAPLSFTVSSCCLRTVRNILSFTKPPSERPPALILLASCYGRAFAIALKLSCYQGSDACSSAGTLFPSFIIEGSKRHVADHKANPSFFEALDAPALFLFWIPYSPDWIAVFAQLLILSHVLYCSDTSGLRFPLVRWPTHRGTAMCGISRH
jgi:hypothetical protein